ncbi:MAG TPA: cytochrome c [Magnetospirillum sp.]|nr:cytochrome c [Magnetospirillum sp.]
MRAIVAVIAALATLVVAGLVWIYSGRFDVSARHASGPLAHWLFDRATRQSVRQAAKDIQAPPVSDPLAVDEGAKHYRDDCAPCHGAPGGEVAVFARSMLPAPTDLTHEGRPWTSAQLFWIVKNGLKFTGMPAWDEVYDDQTTWSVIAFIEQLPQMDAARYKQITAPPPPPASVTQPDGAEPDVIPPSEEEAAPKEQTAPKEEVPPKP